MRVNSIVKFVNGSFKGFEGTIVEVYEEGGFIVETCGRQVDAFEGDVIVLA